MHGCIQRSIYFLSHARFSAELSNDRMPAQFGVSFAVEVDWNVHLLSPRAATLYLIAALRLKIVNERCSQGIA